MFKKTLVIPRKRILLFTTIIVLSTIMCSLANETPLVNTHMQHQSPETEGEILVNNKLLPYHVLPVYGNASLGYYYVTLYVGSPNPQPQTVIVDTGSGILAVPCTQCKSCGKTHLNPPYDPFISTQSKQLTCKDRHPSCKKCLAANQNQNCTFSIYYAEGSSLSGTLIQDDIRFETYATNEQIRAAIGCTQKQTNLFVTQKANGIFGLAPIRDSNLLEELIIKHSQNGQKKQFALCLAPNGGLMTVGGINTELHGDKTKPDISISFKSDQNLYSLVGVQEIRLEETLIFTPLTDRFSGYGIFIDSGSTFSYLPKNKFEILQEKLNNTCINSKRCSKGIGEDSTCYKISLKQGQNLQTEVDKLFPPIRYKILNQNIEWPATKYMLVRDQTDNEVCLGILSLDRYLLGANWMYSRDIIFDLQNKMVHIYNDVKCQKDAKTMGKYLENQDTSQQIIFGRETQLFSGIHINTSQTMFVLGVVFLSFGIIGFLFMLFGCCDSKKNQTAIQLSQEDQNNQIQLSDRPEAGISQVPRTMEQL